VAEFDVARPSIRETLRLLEGLGVIEMRHGQHGGPVVLAVRPADDSQKLSFFFRVSEATYGELVRARTELER
jgi:DNA-binding FadR family transcriptional regulator